MATIRNTLQLYDGLHRAFRSANTSKDLLPGRMGNFMVPAGYAFPERGFRAERGRIYHTGAIQRNMEAGFMSGINRWGMDDRWRGERKPAADGFFWQVPEDGTIAGISSAGQSPRFRRVRGDFDSQSRNINFKTAEPFSQHKTNGTFGLLKNKNTASYEGLFQKALDGLYGLAWAMALGKMRENALWPMMESASVPVRGNDLVHHMGRLNQVTTEGESAPEEALLSSCGTSGMASLIYPDFMAKRLNTLGAYMSGKMPAGWDWTYGRPEPVIGNDSRRSGESAAMKLPHRFALKQSAAQIIEKYPGEAYLSPCGSKMKTESFEHSALNGTAEADGFPFVFPGLGEGAGYRSDEWMKRVLSDDSDFLLTGAFEPDFNGKSPSDGGDRIPLSPDDLKILRELSETGSNRNLVTLTPTVTVTTGDIRNDVDVNDIVMKIERALTVEIAASSAAALGVSG